MQGGGKVSEPAHGDTLLEADSSGSISFGMPIILAGRVAVTRHEERERPSLMRHIGSGHVIAEVAPLSCRLEQVSGRSRR